MSINNIGIDNFFNIAFGFHLSRKKIKKYEIEYDRNENDVNNEFISQL